MSNLSDIVAAVDRLADRLNSAPASSPDASASPLSHGPPGTPTAPPVQWEAKVMPYLSTMTRHLSGIHALMQASRASSSRAVLPIAQPLTPAPVQRSIRRIQAASVRGGGQSLDLMQILSSSFSNIPVAGVAFRQANFAKKLVANLPSLQNADTPLANTAATGGMAATEGVVGNAAMGLALRFGIVAGSVATVGAAVIKFGMAISDANRSISGYSPAMALAFGIADMRDTFRDMKSAQVRAPAEAEFQLAYGNLKDAFRPIKDGFFVAMEELATGLMKILTPIIDLLAKLPQNLEVSDNPLSPLWGFKMNGITSANTEDHNSGVAQAQRALQDAIAALRANTEALLKGWDGKMILAGDFMRGVVGANIGAFGGAQPAQAPMRVKGRKAPMRAGVPPVNTGNGMTAKEMSQLNDDGNTEPEKGWPI